MRELIRKEIREHWKIALAACVLIAVVAWQARRGSTELAEFLAKESFANSYSSVQPLLSTMFLSPYTYLCAMLGALLGFLQIWSERHRDLWAFLAHRPISRNRIFLSKAVAGLGLQTLATGIPLAALVFDCSLPGHVAAPFEWRMALPGLAACFAGMVYYFAGMLATIPQGRWYGPRALGFALAFLVSVAVFFGVAEFWEAIAAVLAGGAILAGAAWAAFQGDGRTPGGGRLGKTALIAAAIPGAVIVAAYAVVMVASLVPGTGGVAGSYHRLAINGKIYKVDTSSDGSSRVADLKGNPLNGADGKPVGSREFNRLSSGALGVTVDFGQGEASPPKYRSVERYFSVKNAARGELWYYWPRYGRIFEFDAKSRRARGSLGPDGFVAGEALPAPAPLFAGRTDPNAGIPQINYATLRDVLATPDAVYEIIFSKCQIWPLFHADPGDSVGGLVRSAFTPDDRPFDVDIVTKSRIYCVNSEGPVLWSTPYQPAYPDYNQIGIHERFLPGSELKAVVWFKPSAVARKKSGGILPDHLVWIGGNATALKAENLPDLPQPDVPVPGLSTGLVAPPAVLLIGSDVLGRDAMATLPASMTCAAVFAVAGWVVARRRNFGLGARVAWAVFHLAFGLPGFLVCLAGMENIAREKCPRCGKLRVVTRKNCEHCGAGFAPPELDGTEILEFPGLAR